MSSSVALRAVRDMCVTFGGVKGFGILFVFGFFPPPSSFCRLSARVHLGISLLLNELLVQEGGSEVPSGLGGDGGGGRGDVLFHMQSALNRGEKTNKKHMETHLTYHPCQGLAEQLLALVRRDLLKMR